MSEEKSQRNSQKLHLSSHYLGYRSSQTSQNFRLRPKKPNEPAR